MFVTHGVEYLFLAVVHIGYASEKSQILAEKFNDNPSADSHKTQTSQPDSDRQKFQPSALAIQYLFSRR